MAICIMDQFYAHSTDSENKSDWQPLEEHLKNVAEMVWSFVMAFGAGDWGYLAGFWHDLGREINGFLC